MTPFDSVVFNRLIKLIADEEASVLAHLRSGALTHDDYKDRTGYLRGLARVAEWMKQVESDTRKGN